jgi:hypothetical protein
MNVNGGNEEEAEIPETSDVEVVQVVSKGKARAREQTPTGGISTLEQRKPRTSSCSVSSGRGGSWFSGPVVVALTSHHSTVSEHLLSNTVVAERVVPSYRSRFSSHHSLEGFEFSRTA